MNQPLRSEDHNLPTRALHPWQLLALILCGFVLWVLGILSISTIGPGLLLYALFVPGTIPAVVFIQRALKLAPQQMTSAVALATAAAVTFDSATFALRPTLYAADPASIILCASQVCWAGAVGLLIALFIEQRALR